MLNKVKRFISQNDLLNERNTYLVALSGGADSVCLLIVLQQLGYQVEAVHCNFHLRGDESDRDERFCEQLCNEKNIPFHRVHFSTREFAGLHHISIEMAARELRYSYFEKLMGSIGADGVCVAHHKDDVAETVLMNLMRGTGIHGLVGIVPKRDYVLRPLLCITKHEITDFLDSIGQSYVTDTSNLCDDIVRNSVRLHVIPALTKANSNAVEGIVATAHRLSDATKLFDDAVESRLRKALLHQSAYDVSYDMLQLLSSQILIFELLSPFGFTSAQTETIFSDIMKRRASDESDALGESMNWHSPTHTAIVHSDKLVIYSNQNPNLSENFSEKTFPLDGYYNLGQLGCYDVKTIVMEEGKALDYVDKYPSVACLDADKLSFPLHLRAIKAGDYFHPYGMKGKKLISDFLTDRKRSLYEKKCQKVLTDESGEIVWLVGERVDNRFAVERCTKRMLKVTFTS